MQLQPSPSASAHHVHAPFDLICLSHLRWQFVFQRPQHLMSRCARSRRVFFVEEPIFDEGTAPRLDITRHDGVHVAVPYLPAGLSADAISGAQRMLLDQLMADEQVARYVLWYYTPHALTFSAHLSPAAVVYDCMDELSAFHGAAPELPRLERALLRRADVVFTGGQSLYEAKKHLHHNIHAMPSSVDVPHFAAARTGLPDPADQRDVPQPRLGFFGVLDERLDVALLAAVADARPAWQLVMVGPVVKIDPALLPRRANIHYLGPKSYADLPAYVGGWDAALLLFARNAATRFISPTKTPEYLAAGKPVVSTSIRDVVTPYGDLGLARIADDSAAFVTACEAALAEAPGPRQARADVFLQNLSWDRTWQRIVTAIEAVLAPAPAAPRAPVVPAAAAATHANEHYV